MAGAGKGKGKSGNASALRAEAGGKKKGAGAPPTRIANAKELRSQFAEVQRSPDGSDPQPLTVPKCVECSHCGWPVYPRDSRVATKKTFERAGIQRDYGDKDKPKKSAEKKDEAGAEAADADDLDLGEEEDGGDGAASEDSVSQVEVLESKVQELDARIEELESFNNSLEKENVELKKQIDDLEEALSAAEEKIDNLEEGELRWREKNSALRVQNEELRLYINRICSRVGDLETDMVKKLIEIRWRKEQTARGERRRALMLARLEGEWRKFQDAALGQAIFKVWKAETDKQSQRRARQEAEEKRRLEVGELRDQLTQEKHHILSLQATTERLRGNLKAAAQRMLMKAMSTTQKPWATGHAMQVWCGAHTSLKLDNEVVRTQHILTETQHKLAEEEAQTSQLTTDLEETTASLKSTRKERDELASNYQLIMTELQKVLGSQSKNASEIQRMAEEKAQAARDALIKETWAEANKLMDNMNKQFDVEKVALEDQVGGLEAQLESINRGLGSGGKAGDDETRVVPKGQGILCVGCLKQIVNRGVKKLPPVSMPRAKSPSRLEEKNKKTFFQKEMLGMPDPDDLLHSEMWKFRRDPMVGMRYAGVSPEVSWPSSTKSASCPRLCDKTPLRIKQELKFQPRAFR